MDPARKPSSAHSDRPEGSPSTPAHVIHPPGWLSPVEHRLRLDASVPLLAAGTPDDPERRRLRASGLTTAAAGSEPGQRQQDECRPAPSFTKGPIGR